MTLTRWKKSRQEFELKNPWWTYRKDITVLPSGKEGEYHSVHVMGASMIIPIMDDGKIMLVNQFRYLGNRESLEFPCGSVKEHSSHDETARHELNEETGFDADELNCMGEFNPYNGVTDEICKIYVARHLRPVQSKHDETEEFEQLLLMPEQLDGQLRAGKIWDGMTLASWALIRHLLFTKG